MIYGLILSARFEGEAQVLANSPGEARRKAGELVREKGRLTFVRPKGIRARVVWAQKTGVKQEKEPDVTAGCKKENAYGRICQ